MCEMKKGQPAHSRPQWGFKPKIRDGVSCILKSARTVGEGMAAGSQAVRSWQERMKILEDIGFIKTLQTGNQRYKHVLLVHPTVAIKWLRDENNIPDLWWNTYIARQIKVKEASFEERLEANKPMKLVPMPVKQAEPVERQKAG
jgi:hypothetical protein